MSHFPKARSKHSLMLDLGCGSAPHRTVCERGGFEYVGVDLESDAAPILGDAHALPFKDESFEFILSLAVLEHIRFPSIAMKEAYRVLHPHGVFIGTVAFLEPCHDDTYYHHTHLGTYNVLREGGFSIQCVCPDEKWPVLVAQACMGLFPKMPRILAKSLVMPLHLLHRVWWGMRGIVRKKSMEDMRIRNTAGSFTFIARR
jgi:SAM-dependent methyltransferase